MTMPVPEIPFSLDWGIPIRTWIHHGRPIAIHRTHVAASQWTLDLVAEDRYTPILRPGEGSRGDRTIYENIEATEAQASATQDLLGDDCTGMRRCPCCPVLNVDPELKKLLQQLLSLIHI